MYSLAEENYLKAIYALWEKSHMPVNTNAIAEHLQTKAASVTDMVKKLSDKKLLKHEKYKGVLLTDKGMKVAISVVRKHRLWEVFLYEKLKFGWHEVHDIAEQLEHIHSEVLIDRLESYLGFPKYDPHGDVIPSKTGEMRKSDFFMLSELKPGVSAIMSGVVDHTSVFLTYLDNTGLALGKSIAIKEIQEFDGSMFIITDGKTEIHISRDVSRNILVREIE
jgi:DtxR family Mn-dependent transcriptional regulator